MKKTLVITDSASTVPLEVAKKLSIKILPFKVDLNGRTFLTSDYTNEEIYKILDEATSLPVTSQITPIEFEEVYLEAFNKGYDAVFLILINSEGSGTFNNSILAKTLFFDDYPKAKGKFEIYSFDGASYTGAYGQIVIDVAEMLKQGTSIEECAKYAEEHLKRRRIYFGIYSLKYAARSGRIPSAAAFVGDALGLKPVMKIFDHNITTAKKVHGEKKIISVILSLVKAEMIPNSKYSVVYGSDHKLKDTMIEKATEFIGYPPINSYQIDTAIAINAGPKIIGLIFDTKDVN